MRDIQLKCYYTQKPASEADRVRIQANIDRLQAELETETDETERNSLRHRIACLQGDRRMPRG
jgi:hypothetical protein